MARPTTQKPTLTTPLRSPLAAQAHAANRVTSTIDLVGRPSRVAERTTSTTSRSVIGLATLTVAVWGFNVAQIISL